MTEFVFNTANNLKGTILMLIQTSAATENEQRVFTLSKNILTDFRLAQVYALYDTLFDEWISYSYIAHSLRWENLQESRIQSANNKTVSAMTHLKASDWPIHS